MGTPDFAVKPLAALTNSPHDVAAVFTRPDKPRGRGNKVSVTPVKEYALGKNIPVYQPETLKTPEAAELIKTLNPDCIAVAAYGLILPEYVLDIPKYGCLNVHASLLPKYRGAAPINRCVMDGGEKSGVTIMQMDSGLDTGDMIISEETRITPEMTATELHDILSGLGSRLLISALENIDTLPRVKQDETLATYAAMLKKDELQIDFDKTPREIHNFIRGLADYPCAYTFIGGKRVKVYRSVIKDNTLEITEVQPEGGKRMSMEAFLRGNKNN